MIASFFPNPFKDHATWRKEIAAWSARNGRRPFAIWVSPESRRRYWESSHGCNLFYSDHRHEELRFDGVQVRDD